MFPEFDGWYFVCGEVKTVDDNDVSKMAESRRTPHAITLSPLKSEVSASRNDADWIGASACMQIVRSCAVEPLPHQMFNDKARETSGEAMLIILLIHPSLVLQTAIVIPRRKAGLAHFMNVRYVDF